MMMVGLRIFVSMMKTVNSVTTMAGVLTAMVIILPLRRMQRELL